MQVKCAFVIHFEKNLSVINLQNLNIIDNKVYSIIRLYISLPCVFKIIMMEWIRLKRNTHVNPATLFESTLLMN